MCEDGPAVGDAVIHREHGACRVSEVKDSGKIACITDDNKRAFDADLEDLRPA